MGDERLSVVEVGEGCKWKSSGYLSVQSGCVLQFEIHSSAMLICTFAGFSTDYTMYIYKDSYESGVPVNTIDDAIIDVSKSEFLEGAGKYFILFVGEEIRIKEIIISYSVNRN